MCVTPPHTHSAPTGPAPAEPPARRNVGSHLGCARARIPSEASALCSPHCNAHPPRPPRCLTSPMIPTSSSSGWSRETLGRCSRAPGKGEPSARGGMSATYSGQKWFQRPSAPCGRVGTQGARAGRGRVGGAGGGASSACVHQAGALHGGGGGRAQWGPVGRLQRAAADVRAGVRQTPAARSGSCSRMHHPAAAPAGSPHRARPGAACPSKALPAPSAYFWQLLILFLLLGTCL